MIQETVVNYQTVSLSVFLQVINLIFLITFLVYNGNFVKKGSIGNKLIHFGPSNNFIKIDILGFKINNWQKWLLVILFFYMAPI